MEVAGGFSAVVLSADASDHHHLFVFGAYATDQCDFASVPHSPVGAPKGNESW
jgi:hypothetical protein